MVRIICTTSREKEDIMRCLVEAEECPFCHDFPICPASFNCNECVENNISWKIIEEEHKE